MIGNDSTDGFELVFKCFQQQEVFLLFFIWRKGLLDAEKHVWDMAIHIL